MKYCALGTLKAKRSIYLIVPGVQVSGTGESWALERPHGGWDHQAYAGGETHMMRQEARALSRSQESTIHLSPLQGSASCDLPTSCCTMYLKGLFLNISTLGSTLPTHEPSGDTRKPSPSHSSPWSKDFYCVTDRAGRVLQEQSSCLAYVRPWK